MAPVDVVCSLVVALVVDVLAVVEAAFGVAKGIIGA